MNFEEKSGEINLNGKTKDFFTGKTKPLNMKANITRITLQMNTIKIQKKEHTCRNDNLKFMIPSRKTCMTSRT